KDGVYVDTSDELIAAVKAGNQVVLGGNIMLGEGMTTQQLKAFPTSMPTTADWTYHKNTGASHPKVSHLLDFKNNLYGNGYSINANKFTTGLFERLGDPFTGPLDFINLMNYAKVKGQDHAAYIVTKDGVEIKNVYLLGCSDESLVENDAINLSLLNNVGTVLELMADCNVQDCRVRNGRTGIRAFGRQISENESPIIQTEAGIYGVTSRRMNVTVDGCILSQAREFLLKVGSNAALDGNDDNLAPSLKKQNGMAYAVPGQNSNILGEDGDYFYNTYVMTDITVKDTIFRDSGLFCIGVESHFAGPFLDNATKGMNVGGIDIQGVLAGAGWDNLASTSLPALIRLEGNVQFHDWKVLDNIDSSSLIEIGDNIQEQLAFLNLQINEMVRKASEVGGYKDLMITKTDAETNTGKQYVHGGICFYGGGKNYSEVIYSDNYTAEKLVDYTINLSMLAKGEQPGSALYQQGTYLPYAAGFESFRFMMFDANSDFDLDKQWQISGQQ
ncbi:MAG: hypothetical protein IKA90_00870, partial [Clostridia bacterium]|nr:hypothetical protein [Clostridia bacterium]